MTWKESFEKLLSFAQWFFGVAFLMAGFGALSEEPFFGLGSLVIGLWLVPPVRRFARGRLSPEAYRRAKWLIPLGGILILLFNAPAQEQNADRVPEGLESLVEEVGEDDVPAATATTTEAAPDDALIEDVPAEPEPPAGESSAQTAPASQTPAPEAGVVVSRVVDGDTFELENGETVRLIGINAPERDQPYAAAATTRLQELVSGQAVRLEGDVNERDRYGRLLAYVFVGETFVNRELVAAGLAKSYAYEPDTARQAELDAAQADAQAAGRGMWQALALNGVSADASQVSFAIAGFSYDAPGNDNESLDQESVTLQNSGAQPVVLARYTLSDEANHTYTFPDVTLAPGATVTLVTGAGTDTATTLYWGLDGAVWNNGGDTLFLANPAGEVVFTYGY
jgi:micrococcal nuclease